MKEEDVCSSFRAGRLVTKSSGTTGCKSELVCVFTLLEQFTALTRIMESWRGLLEYWYLGYESLGISSGVMEATFQGKEIKQRGFEAEARVSWGRPQNTRRWAGTLFCRIEHIVPHWHASHFHTGVHHISTLTCITLPHWCAPYFHTSMHHTSTLTCTIFPH